MVRLSAQRIAFFVLILSMPATGVFAAQQPLVSTMRNVKAVSESRGYFINPASDSAGQIIPGDEAPTQAFEVIRPSNSRVTIGRLFTSCSCIQLEAAKRTYEPGERIVLTLRNIRPTPSTGQTYALYVQLTSPVRTTLRYDTFVQSSRFIVVEPTVVTAVEEVTQPESEPAASSEATVVDATATTEVKEEAAPDESSLKDKESAVAVTEAASGESNAVVTEAASDESNLKDKEAAPETVDSSTSSEEATATKKPADLKTEETAGPDQNSPSEPENGAEATEELKTE